MRSPSARKVLDEAVEKQSRRAQGQLPSPLLLNAAHVTELLVADQTALPVLPNNQRLTNDSGQPLFLIGYSVIGGPDVMG